MINKYQIIILNLTQLIIFKCFLLLLLNLKLYGILIHHDKYLLNIIPFSHDHIICIFIYGVI